MSGGTVKGVDYPVLYNQTGAEMVIKGGTVSSSNSAGLYNADGTLTVTDGSISGVSGVYNEGVFKLSGKPEIR